MLTVVQYLGALLVIVIFLIVAFCLLFFLFGLLKVWVLKNETRGISRKQLKKAEQEICKHHNTVCVDGYLRVNPMHKWKCCDCGKSL